MVGKVYSESIRLSHDFLSRPAGRMASAGLLFLGLDLVAGRQRAVQAAVSCFLVGVIRGIDIRTLRPIPRLVEATEPLAAAMAAGVLGPRGTYTAVLAGMMGTAIASLKAIASRSDPHPRDFVSVGAVVSGLVFASTLLNGGGWINAVDLSFRSAIASWATRQFYLV